MANRKETATATATATEQRNKGELRAAEEEAIEANLSVDARKEVFEDDEVETNYDNEEDPNEVPEEMYLKVIRSLKETTSSAYEDSIDQKLHLIIGKWQLDDESVYVKTVREWVCTYKSAPRLDKRQTARHILCDLVNRGCRFYQYPKTKTKGENQLCVPVECGKRIEDRIMRDCARFALEGKQDYKAPAEGAGAGEGEDNEPATVEDACIALNTLMVQATTEAAAKAMRGYEGGNAQIQPPPVPHVNVPTQDSVAQASDIASRIDGAHEGASSMLRPSPSSLVTEADQQAQASQNEAEEQGDTLMDPALPVLALTRDIGSWDANQDLKETCKGAGDSSSDDQEKTGIAGHVTCNANEENAINGSAQSSELVGRAPTAKHQARDLLTQQFQLNQEASRRSSFNSVPGGMLLPRPPVPPEPSPEMLSNIAVAAIAAPSPPGAKKNPPQTTPRKRKSPRKAAANTQSPASDDGMPPPPKPSKRPRRSPSNSSNSVPSNSKKKAPPKKSPKTAGGTKSSGRASASKGAAGTSPKRASTRAAAAAAKAGSSAKLAKKKTKSTKDKKADTLDQFDMPDEQSFHSTLADMVGRLVGLESRMRVMETQNRRFKQRLVDLEDEEDLRGSETIEQAASAAAGYQPSSAEDDAEEGGDFDDGDFDVDDDESTLDAE